MRRLLLVLSLLLLSIPAYAQQSVSIAGFGASVDIAQDWTAGQDVRTTAPGWMCRGGSSTPTPVLDGKAQYVPCSLDGMLPFNLARVNGVTMLAGNGVTGTGSIRITIASDNSPVAGMGVGATASAVPANANYVGAQNASGNLSGDIVCENSKIYDASTSGNTELVALSGTKHVYVCGYELLAAGTVNLSLVAGTGTACASAASGTPSTGTSGASAALTPAWQFTTQTGKLSAYPAHGWLLDTGSANALCIKASGGVAAQAQVWYSQR